MADADFQLCRRHRIHAKTLESYRNTKASNKRFNRGGGPKHQSKRAKTSNGGTENASHTPDTSAPTATAKKAAVSAPTNPSYENPNQQGQLAEDFQ